MVKERSPQKNAQKYAIRLEKYLYILFWTINKVDMRIFIGKPLHVLEVPYYQNYLEYPFTLRRIESPVICQSWTQHHPNLLLPKSLKPMEYQSTPWALQLNFVLSSVVVHYNAYDTTLLIFVTFVDFGSDGISNLNYIAWQKCTSVILTIKLTTKIFKLIACNSTICSPVEVLLKSNFIWCKTWME